MEKILFICSNNLIRSVMAEFIMKERLSNAGIHYIVVDSCSYKEGVETSIPVRSKAYDVLKEHQIPYVVKSVQYYKEEYLNDYDLIICMDEFVYHSLEKKNEKVIYWNIEDPIATGNYEEVFNTIDKKIKQIVDKNTKME